MGPRYLLCHQYLNFLVPSWCPIPFFTAFKRVSKISGSFVTSVRLSLCLFPRLHGTTRLPLDRFSLNLIFDYFLNSVETVQVWLKSDNNNGYFTWRNVYSYHNISLNSSYNKKYFWQNLYRESKRTFYVQHFFFENRAFYKIIYKNVVQPDRPQTPI
jgi:hypothetical protein